MLRKLLALVLASLLAACASRPADVVTVHIFSNQPDHAEVLALGERLEAAGYRHRVTYAQTPGGLEVAETVIVYGDSAGAFNRAQELARMLSSPGGSIRMERKGYGNHHFTAGNLGLYLYLPGGDPMPQLRVHAHLAGTCGQQPVELFLLIDRSYRLEAQRWRDDYTLVDAGNTQGDWAPKGSGYTLTSPSRGRWSLEPPLDADPALQVYFVRDHPDFEDCRLAEPL